MRVCEIGGGYGVCVLMCNTCTQWLQSTKASVQTQAIKRLLLLALQLELLLLLLDTLAHTCIVAISDWRANTGVMYATRWGDDVERLGERFLVPQSSILDQNPELSAPTHVTYMPHAAGVNTQVVPASMSCGCVNAVGLCICLLCVCLSVSAFWDSV